MKPLLVLMLLSLLLLAAMVFWAPIAPPVIQPPVSRATMEYMWKQRELSAAEQHPIHLSPSCLVRDIPPDLDHSWYYAVCTWNGTEIRKRDKQVLIQPGQDGSIFPSWTRRGSTTDVDGDWSKPKESK